MKHSTGRSMRILFLILLGLLLTRNGFSQNQSDAIQCRVVDIKSKQPIPFASVKIWIKSKLSGVISNDDGDFQIPSSYKEQIDSIVISCIGYSNHIIKMDQLLNNGLN